MPPETGAVTTAEQLLAQHTAGEALDKLLGEFCYIASSLY